MKKRTIFFAALAIFLLILVAAVSHVANQSPQNELHSVSAPPEDTSSPSPEASAIDDQTDAQERAYMQRIAQLAAQAQELGLSCDLEDLRYLFAFEVERAARNSDTREDAVSFARLTLENKLMLYHYANENGFALSEEQLEQQMQDSLAMAQSSSKYADYQAIFENSGLSYEEYVQFHKELSRLDGTVHQFQNWLTKEGVENNHHFDGKWVEDYSSYYIETVVIPAEEQYQQEILEPLLDEAEQFYDETFADDDSGSEMP